MDIEEWTVDDVTKWLNDYEFTDLATLFLSHKIDGQALLLLTEKDLHHMQIEQIGVIKHLVVALRKLQATSDLHFKENLNMSGVSVGRWKILQSQTSYTSSCSDEITDLDGKERLRSYHLEPEYLKLIISFVYMCTVFMITSFSMVIVHDRVPDMEKYPPLPDIVLDNLPYIPWAFELCELTAGVLCLIFCGVLFFHKHRFIVIRRLCSLVGTIYLLRSFCMLITSLSVPGVHLKCAPKAYGSFWLKLERAYEISTGMGMAMAGVRTCGDYMYSGHTCIVTILNFFITEYTPVRMYRLHTATWVMNLFAIFFILAAHEHYSIDVFIAFYLSSRLFLYYHSLANNRALMQQDRKRVRIWFPLFSFFESKCNGVVPNEYEWPIKWPLNWDMSHKKSD